MGYWRYPRDHEKPLAMSEHFKSVASDLGDIVVEITKFINEAQECFIKFKDNYQLEDDNFGSAIQIYYGKCGIIKGYTSETISELTSVLSEISSNISKANSLSSKYYSEYLDAFNARYWYSPPPPPPKPKAKPKP